MRNSELAQKLERQLDVTARRDAAVCPIPSPAIMGRNIYLSSYISSLSFLSLVAKLPVTHAEESDAAVQAGLVQLHLLILNIITIS